MSFSQKLFKLNRIQQNPILSPDPQSEWESTAVFNGCPIRENSHFYLYYRAMSKFKKHKGAGLNLSTIGRATSTDGINFKQRQQFIVPEYDWEAFGCEDPRITKFENKYYIFYTALSTWPPSPPGIRVALAATCNLDNIEEKYQITPFNAKAAALFPERIYGKYALILTANTDIPPARIGIALLDREEDLWSRDYWERWYRNLEANDLGLSRSENDQIEVGAPPIKTPAGWLLIYSYIKNYRSGENRTFGIEAALLDPVDPRKVIGRTSEPILTPETPYELYGQVGNVVFPSGALVIDGQLFVYYGGADTTCCMACGNLNLLLEEMIQNRKKLGSNYLSRLIRYDKNPIIKPKTENLWERKATFNPTAIYLDKKVHILYRAMSDDDTSVLGYASSPDGIHIDERLSEPVYVPREEFEKKATHGNSGCEDPRITRIEDTLYMLYTGYNAKGPTRIALTTIKVSDFLAHKWNWSNPKLISPPDLNQKNSCVLEQKINGKYAIMHRIDPSIWIDFVEEVEFGDGRWIRGKILMQPRPNSWDSEKIGIAGPPILTNYGWILIYHGLSRFDKMYRLGAALLDRENPTKVLSRLTDPILEPEASYEHSGIRPGTVFSCGAVVIDNLVYVYYGAGDTTTAVATVRLPHLLTPLLNTT